jgi:hypothetical protein
MLDDAALAELPGKPLLDADGSPVGTIDDVFAFAATDLAAWVAVDVGGTRRLVPLEGTRVTGDGVRAGYPRDVIEGAPEGEGDTVRPSEALYAHFALTDAGLRDDSGFPVDQDARATRARATRAASSAVCAPRRGIPSHLARPVTPTAGAGTRGSAAPRR